MSKKLIKKDNICSEHKKRYIYSFSGLDYCESCLDAIFQGIYKLDNKFQNILEYNKKLKNKNNHEGTFWKNLLKL